VVNNDIFSTNLTTVGVHRKIISCRDKNIVKIYQDQMQLLRGWLEFQRDIYEFEIYGAAARVGVNIDLLHYLIPDHESSESLAATMHREQAQAGRFRTMVRYTSAQKWDSFLAYTDGNGGGKTEEVEQHKYNYSESMKQLVSLKVPSAAVNGNGPTANSSKATSRRVTLKSSLHANNRSHRRRVTIREVLEPCIKYATQLDAATQARGRFFSWAMAIGVTLVPLLMDNPLHHVTTTKLRISAYIYLGTSSILTMFWGMVCFQFLFTATVDTQRRLRLASLLSGLVRPVHQDYSPRISWFGFDGISIKGIIWKQFRSKLRQIPVTDDVEEGGKSSAHIPRGSNITRIGNNDRPFEIVECPEQKLCHLQEWQVPKVDFEIPQNIYAWMYTRLVVQNYGNRMLFRISVYSGGIFLQVVIALLGIIFAILHSSTPKTLAARPVVIQCIMLAVFSMLVLIKYISLGSHLNEEFASHRNLLVLNAMRCESELAELLTSESDTSLSQNKNNHLTGPDSTVHISETVPLMSPSKDKQVSSKITLNSGVKMAQSEGDRGHRNARGNGVVAFGDFDSGSHENSQSLTQYQQLALSRMGSRFNINGTDAAETSIRIISADLRNSSPLVGKPTSLEAASGEKEAATPQAVPAPFAVASAQLPDTTVKARLKIFELEESVKAMRRAVDAIDISNREYTAKVKTFHHYSNFFVIVIVSAVKCCYLVRSLEFLRIWH
jgi:hypothetical protein